MQEETKRSIWKWAGYTLFFLAAFGYFLYRTFPYKQMFDRYSTPFQRRSKVRIKVDDLHPYWLSGVEATNIIVRLPFKKRIAAVKINEARVHASLFRLLFGKISASFDAALARGTIDGSVVQDGNFFDVTLRIDGLNLNALGEKRKRKRRVRRSKKKGKKGKKAAAPPANHSLLATLFAPVYGRLKARVSLRVPQPGARFAPVKSKKGGRSRRRRPTRGMDLTRLQGTIRVNIRNLSIGPGEFPTERMGDLPVPLVRLGKFALVIKISKGKATISRCEANGTDGALRLTGSVQLRRRIRYAAFRGKLEFKINKAFVDNIDPQSILKAGLGMLGPPPSGGFYRYRIRLPFGGGRATFRRF